MIIYGPPRNSPSPLPGHTMEEQRSFDFFRARTAAQFAGPFSSELWSKLLPRLSLQEDAIRHAIVAIGALHETADSAADANAEYAMRQYGKAISDVLVLDISKSDTAADTALISCVLFTAFESMQGHYRSAMTHVTAGLKILREQEVSNRKEAYMPRELAKSAFMQLDTQSREIGDVSLRPILKLSWRTNPPATTLQTLDQAKGWLEDYMRNLTEFLTTLGPSLRANPDDLTVVLQEHAEKKDLFYSWCLACRHIDATYVRLLDGTPTPAAQGYLILRLWRIVINMLLNVELQFGETGWDAFEADFRKLVSIAEKFVKNSAQLEGTLGPRIEDKLPTCKPTISFSIGIVTPLFLTATRCRDPVIRRSACEVLRACNRSESMWNSTLAARVSERVIELEEQGLGKVSSTSQVPLEARILGMDLAFGPDRQGKVKYYQYSPLAGVSVDNCKSFEEELSWARLPTSCHHPSAGTMPQGSTPV
jgi:Fungal specific transcription factor domain